MTSYPSIKKTDRDRVVLINATVVHALQRHIKNMNNEDFLFRNNRKHNTPISVSYLGTLVKTWCKSVDLTENYGSHTLRKTWGYMQRKHNNASTLLLKQAFGHQHEWQTIAYLGVENEEIAQLYKCAYNSQRCKLGLQFRFYCFILTMF